MKKSKKILLGLSPIAAILPAVAVSCGNNDESNISFKEKDISKYTTTNANGKQVVKNAELLKLKPVLITDESKIDDKSFNQSAFEALKAINKQTGIEINSVEPSSNFESAYNSALSAGHKIWVLNGFKHQQSIKQYIDAHREELERNQIKIIGIDFDIETEYKWFYSLQFNIKEPAFTTGYAIASWLSEQDESKRVVASFGGGAFPGVTTFNEGFAKGILYYNQKHKSSKIYHTSPVKLDSGFTAGEKMNTVINNVLSSTPADVKYNPHVILSVAGPATFETVRLANKGQYVIGVDSDQGMIQDKDRILTSVLKHIKQAVYETLLDLILEKEEGYKPYVVKDKKADKKWSHFGTQKEKWIGVAENHFSNTEEQAKINNKIKEAIKMFKELPEDFVKYINSDKALKDGNKIDNVSERLEAIISAINKAAK
uniref:Macrophage activating lipoprotein-404 n=1 Tax=Mycoplasmopsis fermentans TaxID=2115 RepID=Q9RGX3_MYCFE|nr:macrophage activating lipoprotein-404 precursor [Mycoplasmopsis fermentans]